MSMIIKVTGSLNSVPTEWLVATWEEYNELVDNNEVSIWAVDYIG